MSRAEFVNALSEWEVKALELYEERLDQPSILKAVLCPGPDELADLINRWRAVKGVTTATVPAQTAEPEPTIESRILQLHEQGMSDTDIVYTVWNKSGSGFKERMSKVKDVLATATAAAASKTPNLPLQGVLATATAAAASKTPNLPLQGVVA